MSEPHLPQPEPLPDPGAAEVIVPETVETVEAPLEPDSGESIQSPAKVMRIGSMIKQLLEEVRGTELDEPSRERLREIYETSVAELGEAISPDLRDELARLDPSLRCDHAHRRRAAGRQGPAGRLARGPLPRDPGHPVRAADGRPAQLEEMRRQLGPGAVPGRARPGGSPRHEARRTTRLPARIC